MKKTIFALACLPFFLFCFPTNDDDPEDAEPVVEVVVDETAPGLDDALEPNNSMDSATLLSSRVTNQLALMKGEKEEDWYKIYVSDPYHIKVKIHYAEKLFSTSDFPYVEIRRADGSYVRSHNRTFNANTSPDSVETIGSKTDSLYLRVCSKLRTTSCHYSLEISESVVADDLYEDNDSPGQAKPIAMGDHAGLVFMDDDYYRVYVRSGELLQASLKYAYYSGNGLLLRIANSSGSVLDQEKCFSNTTTIRHIAGRSDSFRVWIDNVDNPAGAYYGLTISTGAAKDDAYEPNQTRLTAKTLTAGVYSDLFILKNDSDWYKIVVPANTYLSADVAYSYKGSSVNRLEVSLVDSVGYTLSRGYYSTDTLRASYHSVSGGTFYIRVKRYRSSASEYITPYALTLRAPTASLVDDSLEENDTYRTAAWVTPGIYPSLTMFANDTDWYALKVAGTGTLSVRIDYNRPSFRDGLRMRIYKRIGGYPNSVAVSVSDGGDSLKTSYMVHTVSGKSDTMYVKVYRYDPSRIDSLSVPYRLTVAFKPYVLKDDAFEDNDTKFAGTALKAGKYESLYLVRGDEDWYKLGVAANQLISFKVFLNRSGISSSSNAPYLALYSLESSQSLASSSYAYGDSMQLEYVAPKADTYYVRMTFSSSSGSSIPLSLSYRIDLALTSVAALDDAKEENDSQSSPALLAAGKHTGLVSLKGDPDWYKIAVTEKSWLVIDVTNLGTTSSYTRLTVGLYSSSSSGSLIRSQTCRYGSPCQIEHYAKAAGNYYVSVKRYSSYDTHPSAPLTVKYSLEVQVNALSILDDRLEENDALASAAPLAPGFYDSLKYYDEDWYAVALTKDVPMRIDVLFGSQGQRGFELSVNSSAGIALKKVPSSSSYTQMGMDFTPTTTGTYYIRFRYIYSSSTPLFLEYYGLRVMPK